MTEPPDDATLLRRGISAPPPKAPALERVMLIACGALAREILALRALNGWDHLDLECLPARLHNSPQRIPQAVRARARAARARGYGRVFVLYGDCGTAGQLDVVCVEEGLERIAGAHCFAFYSGVEAFAARAQDDADAFHLTDFLARQFDALVWRGMGVARHPELREMLFSHYNRVVHLAQTDDPETDRAARDAARKLGLAHERRFTGFGDLGATLGAMGVEGGAWRSVLRGPRA